MKKLPSLHILNGDASLASFRKANFPGQVLIWRETLSEGPSIGTLTEQEFWQKRQQYITRAYHESPEAYKQKVLNEITKLNFAHAFFEVILWFDADLMCQVNLLFLVQKLYQVKTPIISVCTPDKEKSIGYLKAEELHQLFENRLTQTKEQLQQATQLWQLYAGPDPLQLQTYLQQHNILNPDLKDALELHLKRFPDCATGLGGPERIMLQLINKEATTLQELMQQFWQLQPGYGFGNWQLQHILYNLQPDLVQATVPLKLTALGTNILNGKERYTPAPQWLGGAFIKPGNTWCYSSEKKELIKETYLAPNVQ